MLKVVSGLVIALFAFTVGCGSETGTTTVTERQTTTVIRDAPATAAGDDDARAEDDDRASGKRAESAGRIDVPDVVGKDHQLAQDTMQSAGLYNLSEEDATGQGRLMLIDRNWVVVEQEPRAGSRVNEDATIVLRSKKVGE